jgi:hypothetical protein
MFVSAGVRRAYELAHRLVAQDVDLTLKIGFEKPDIAEQRGVLLSPLGFECDRYLRDCHPVLIRGLVREDDLNRGALLPGDLVKDFSYD